MLDESIPAAMLPALRDTPPYWRRRLSNVLIRHFAALEDAETPSVRVTDGDMTSSLW